MVKKVFYRCKKCGNLVGLIEDGKVPMICCGEPMEKLVPNTTDGAHEKHVPAFELNGSELHVQVGSVPHPMTEEHYIMWIMVTQGNKTQRVELTPQDEPKADFHVEADKPFAIYEYCNLHGLWMAESK